MNKKGYVYMHSDFAGTIEQNDEGFLFEYDNDYLKSEKAKAVSLTLPLQSNLFLSKTMIPFFDGLIPEGWLLSVAQQVWKIDKLDRMELLLSCCKDTKTEGIWNENISDGLCNIFCACFNGSRHC